MRKIILTVGATLILSSTALAVPDTPTPTPTVDLTASPTATSAPTASATVTVTPGTPVPTVAPCASVQSYIETQVPAVVTASASSFPACTVKPERFVVTAGQLATRALALRRCDQPSALRSRLACSLCYERAKNPLRVRYKGELFRGLLSTAVKAIEEQKKAVCRAIARAD
jgi:hypothetical protein